MGFKECGACKKPYTTLLSEQSRKDALGAFVRYDVKAMCDSAQVYVSENKFDKAVELLKKACLHMTSSGLDASDINQMIAECQTKERLYDEAQERQAEEQRTLDAIRKQNEIEAGKLARKERGLAFLLEKKVSGDELKISSLMQGVSRIKDFLKKNHGYSLTDNDAESVHQWLCSIEVPTKKQEKKDFQDWNGQSWKYLSSQFADAQKWFEEVNAKDSLK